MKVHTSCIRPALIARVVLALVIGSTSASLSRADGNADNNPTTVRPVPKPGIVVSPAKRQALEAAIRELGTQIDELRQSKNPQVAPLLPDILIYTKAAHDALTYQEFFAERDVDIALELLAEGKQRATDLSQGSAPWTTATGLVVRGYVSKIDGSVQPYGLVVPPSYSATSPSKFRLDLWFHGRGEVLSEVNFLQDRRKNAGTFTPPNTIVLHPYGRYCNAAKLAGEIDALEALESVKERYAIDDDRVTVRGFSMGGASAWHLAAHYPGMWAAANPGAGFSETPEFLKFFQKEELHPTWWEEKLWQLYDSNRWAGNFLHCPTVAYSGELDIQKQAADVMADALKREGIELVHVVAPGTKHSYEPKARDAVDRKMSELVALGRDRMPRSLQFSTYTLRYNNLAWLTVDALDEHWLKGQVSGEIDASGVIKLNVENVAALSIAIPSGRWPFRDAKLPRIEIADRSPGVSERTQVVHGEYPALRSDRSWQCSIHREGGRWVAGARPADELRKTHGLQGPIDDAFLDAFVFVRPTGHGHSPEFDAWVQSELDRATRRWRTQFRGEAPVKNDRDVTDEEIASKNLILWGDAQSNCVIARVAEKLPIRYDGDFLGAHMTVGSQRFEADHHALILIYPNPLNRKRYVVLNSGFTFREFADLNNARQVPKLPDWAIIDIRTPPDTLWPGKVVAADFFGEKWELRPTTSR